jgi:hypothetical protein
VIVTSTYRPGSSFPLGFGKSTSVRNVRAEGFRDRKVCRYVKPSDKQTEAAQEDLF